MLGYDKALGYLLSNNVDKRNLAIIWFNWEENSFHQTIEWIQEKTKLAYSTIKNYIRKYKSWLNKAIETFQDTIESAYFNSINNGCYILHVFTDQGEFTKIGRSNNINDRVKNIQYKGWRGVKVFKVDILAKFFCPDKAISTILENDLRSAMIRINRPNYVETDRLKGYYDFYLNQIINYYKVQDTIQEFNIKYAIASN